MAPKDVHTQIPGTCEYATLHGKSRDGPACCQGQARETVVSGALELPGRIYTMEIIKCHTRDPPYPREPNVKHLPTYDQLVCN